jgi:hypothetical protein
LRRTGTTLAVVWTSSFDNGMTVARVRNDGQVETETPHGAVSALAVAAHRSWFEIVYADAFGIWIWTHDENVEPIGAPVLVQAATSVRSLQVAILDDVVYVVWEAAGVITVARAACE